MIAIAKNVDREKSPPTWHAAFLAMLPTIRQQANYAFRRMRPDEKEDAMEEIVCATCAAFGRLVAQGKADVACPSALVRFAVRQFRCGRRLGCTLNVKDVSSTYCRLQKQVVLERLDKRDRQSKEWEEILLEDRNAGPAETAAARIDVADWFQRMCPRDRRIALALGFGERTQDVAKQFRISEARVSQKRRGFRRDWDTFQAEKSADYGSA
jgi:hypothetical protein